MERAKIIDAQDKDAVAAAHEAAEATLPAAGYARQEALKSRAENLAVQAEKMAAQMLLGTIDPKYLQIASEIAGRIEYLNVSNPQPGFVYQWVSTNRSGFHVQKAKQLGYEVVQGKDPEAMELIGDKPGTTRTLEDVLLMRIPEERYVVLKALEIKRAREVQGASSSNLIALVGKYGHVARIKPYRMDTLEGPAPQPGRFTKNQAKKWLENELRTGTQLQKAMQQ
jgi:hypothetical protein